MPTIVIDGRTIDASADASVLDAALANDIWIPTLCHNECLSEYGACRLCLVEVTRRKRTKVTASCTLPAQEGMEIVTNSDRIQRLRRLVVELIVASCPASDAIVEMAERLGAQNVRLAADPQNDCIRCGLCVRACAEISGACAIDFAGRGLSRTITTPFAQANPKCVLCGACVFVCPTGSRLLDLAAISGEEPQALTSRFEAHLAQRGAISRPFPQALPNVPAIDRTACLRLNCGTCGICESVCEADAIRFDDEDREDWIDVGAVVTVPGFDEFRPYAKYEFGYSRCPDVLTSIEFERMLSASGPFMGHVVRPSDGKEPRHIAFLQCVGSRDISCRNGYCSSVCCMYAVKEAVMAKEHLSGVEAAVFFMDVRAFGKGFDAYCERAETEQGVRFVRARVHDVVPGTDGQLRVRYCSEGENVQEETFDLAVLSIGLEPSDTTRELARGLGLNLNEFGFLWTDADAPLSTSRPGVFAAGPAVGPKDIPETVVEASAAACEAGRLLADVAGSLTVEAEFPPERNVASEPPRIGLFVCHCGANIGGVVDVPSVAEYAAELPHVVFAEDNLYTCSQDSQDYMKRMIDEHGLNRVVVASCSPRTHEPLFQETMRQSGLNPSLFAMANIRDQCSWAHMNDPAAATAKARDLVRMAVSKAALAEPLHAARVPVIREGLVVGGGVAGMTAALAVADHGYDVMLVEKSDGLGGNLQHLYDGFEGQDLQRTLSELKTRVMSHPQVTVRLGTTLAEVSGFVGNFETALSDGSRVRHGIAIVATGGSEYEPAEHLYGQDSRVLTQRTLQQRLAADAAPWDTPPARVVMIQCVGSRNDEHPYCSRVCCTRAVLNAIHLKELSPATEVQVLYRDIRTYGFKEGLYQRARELGVHFVRFTADAEPEVIGGEQLSVRFHEPTIRAQIRVEADLIVLSTGIVADVAANDELAKQFKVPMTDDGFFLEAHAKLRPVEFATEGVYLAGLAHGPKSVNETRSQALAAASRACTVLQHTEIEAQATTADVRPEKCVACGLCESVCAYGAITLEMQRIGREERLAAKVNPALCKGCGACVAGCRSGALNLRGFTDQQILAEILEL